MSPIITNFENARYFPVARTWSKLRPVYYSQAARDIWLPNLVEYWLEKAREHGFTPHFRYTETPSDFDSCDWRCSRRGRHPEFWLFVCHAACHWLVDLHLHVAMTTVPRQPWRILSSEAHSTVWNGNEENPILFDLNFLALEIAPAEALRLSSTGPESTELEFGERLRNPSFGIDYIREHRLLPR